MNLNYHEFSSSYEIRKITKKDISSVYGLCSGNPIYYQYMKTTPTMENLEAVISVLPPDKTMDDKYFVGYFKANKLIAILDLIAEYPDESTAFIGWFMVDMKWQGKGIGSGIIKELQTALQKMKFKKMRLGYIKGNAQSAAFWKSNGFLPNGEESETEEYTVVVAEKELR